MKRILIFCLLLSAIHVSAQQVLTVEQAIDLALKNNYDIRLAKNDAAIAANDYAYANWSFAPRINATNMEYHADQTGIRKWFQA